jgi:RNA polymerase sigma factor, sigma-70 family
MDINNLVLHSEYLYKIAYHKMNNTNDADELTQETLLQALIELRKNPDKAINNEQAWLSGILNNCFYTMMRKKYKTSYVTYDVIMDNYLSEDNINEFIENEETAELYSNIKRSVSILAKIHRDVIHLFYIKNKSVNEIAEKLNIPRGTVLSRLDNGRKLIKKGVINMDKNTIYVPQKFGFGIHGRHGDHSQPFNAIKTTMHSNILILAYEKPVTESELSEIIGIPCVFIEEMVNGLVADELMKRTSGGKVYTDFVIKFEKDILKANETMVEIINKTFDAAWIETANFIDEVKTLNFISVMNERQKNKLAVYAGIMLMDSIIQRVKKGYLGKITPLSEFPDRPYNGKWYATGDQWTDVSMQSKYVKYNISGLLSCGFEYKGLHIEVRDYQTSFGDTHFKYLNSTEQRTFLYDIKTNDISRDNEKFVKDIPKLCEAGFIDNSDNVLKLDIPQLSFDEMAEIEKLANSNTAVYDIVKQPMLDYYKERSSMVPAHLKDSILPEFTIDINNALMTGYLVTAKEKGLFLKDVDYPCPAMVFIS